MRFSAVASVISGDFSGVIDKFCTKSAPDAYNVAIRKIAIEVFRRIIMGTPVKEGRARGNWQASIESPKEGTLGKVHNAPVGGAPIAHMINVVRAWTPNDDLPAFITNNLPYIQRLNEGWSKQAPANYIEQVIADLGGIARMVV
jgi:hypothetical protein